MMLRGVNWGGGVGGGGGGGGAPSSFWTALRGASDPCFCCSFVRMSLWWPACTLVVTITVYKGGPNVVFQRGELICPPIQFFHSSGRI